MIDDELKIHKFFCVQKKKFFNLIIKNNFKNNDSKVKKFFDVILLYKKIMILYKWSFKEKYNNLL